MFCVGGLQLTLIVIVAIGAKGKRKLNLDEMVEDAEEQVRVPSTSKHVGDTYLWLV